MVFIFLVHFEALSIKIPLGNKQIWIQVVKILCKKLFLQALF